MQVNDIARRSGFVKRVSKLAPEHFLECMMFADLEQGSLQDCCDDIVLHNGVRVSKVALHKRFNSSSVDFVREVLSAQMSSRMDFHNRDWSGFTAVVISDSCKFQLPGKLSEVYPAMGRFAGGSSLMNIQYGLDIKSGSWRTLDFTRATENDQRYSGNHLKDIGSSELHIRDLGYVTHGYLLGVVRQEAFFLNRLHTSCRPIEKATGKQINWTQKHLEMLNGKHPIDEIPITIGKGIEAVECRLIAVQVPEKVWEERIRKANIQAKRQGYSLTDEYKNRARFSLFITNVKDNRLSTEMVAELYRLRWQVELMFKNWKSLFRVHKHRSVGRERLECQLLGKLLRIVVNWKIYKCIDLIASKRFKGRASSMWKVFKHLRAINKALRGVLKKEITTMDWFNTYIDPIINSLLLEPKKGKKAAFQIINDIFKA